MERKIIKCEHCGEEIGRLVKINYPQDSFLWDKIDFEIEEYNNFGDAVDNGFLCQECSIELKEEEDDEDFFEQEGGYL